MTLKAILWDMDGTLINSESAHQQAFSNALTSLGKTVPTNLKNTLLGASFVEVHQKLVEFTGLDLSVKEWNSLKWKHYLVSSKGIDLLRNRQNILDIFKNKSIPMALVSNSTRDEVDLNLNMTKLTDYFEYTVSRNDVALGKPAPDGYLAAAKALAISPDQCLVIEDSITGAIAGLTAGMMTLFHPETDELCAYCPEGAISLPPKEDLTEWLTAAFASNM
jgi:HAD superfamily hydrolase (TIGR01509 family)